ncbi:MAG: hypothetical protein WDO19_21800 [Bacteroidota bacterium]
MRRILPESVPCCNATNQSRNPFPNFHGCQHQCQQYIAYQRQPLYRRNNVKSQCRQSFRDHTKNGITTTYLWGYNNNFPTAKTLNALNAATAHTSFEADGNSSWTIGSSNRITNDGITGKQSYQLSGGAVTKTGLTTGQSYIVSYWTKNASAFTISGTQGSPIQGRTVSGWTYFEHKVTGVTQVSLSGTGLIDELRLYPAEAQMITYTYDPLFGMTSQCDINNIVTYYEYDALSRLKLIRDQDKNVIRTIEYKYGGIN